MPPSPMEPDAKIGEQGSVDESVQVRQVSHS